MKRIKFQKKVLLRSSSIVFSLVALFAFLNACLWYVLKQNYLYTSPVLSFVTFSLQLALLVFIFFLFSSYEMSSKLRRTGATERVASVSEEFYKTYASQFLLLIILAVVINFNVFLWHLYAYYIYGLLSARAIIHSLLAIILYYFLPECIAILMGISLSTKKRPFAYSIIILYSVAVSSIPLRLFSAMRIGCISVASILDWFHLTVPDADWMPDSVYGVPMELARWIIACFWIFLLLLIIIYHSKQNTRRNIRAILFFLTVIVLITGFRFADRHNDSIVYKDDRPDGLQNSLYYYYNDVVLPKEEVATFAIKSYEIVLQIQSNLKAKVSMSIEYRDSQAPLCFTLHHGLDVEKVCKTDGSTLEYSRDIDYLTVYTKEPEIVVYYSGNLGKYYSNYQAVYLPGYAAFYPIPGIQHLWNYEKNTIKPLILTEKNHYSVFVECGQSVFCNLERMSPNTFSGDSTSIGVFSGLLTLTEKENVSYLESILNNSSSFWSIDSFEKSWREYHDFFELSESISLREKLVVFHPATILGFYPSDKFVGDGTIIYFGDLVPRPETLAYEMVISRLVSTSQNQLLYTWFTMRIYSLNEGEQNAVVEKPAYNELQIYNKKMSDYTEEDWITFGSKMALFEQLMSYQEEKLGTELFLNSIYSYLQDPNPEKKVVDFIYYLEKE